MGFVELLLIAVGLSMDAFAVSLCKGLSMRRMDLKQGALIALFFGVFQAVMPLIGWALGRRFEQYITAVDHWIAFGLLAFIGGKMLWEAIRSNDLEDACEAAQKISLKELTVLAVATSIDALAVGITFAFLSVSIVPSVALIGATTFVISLGGVVIGNKFGAKLKQRAEIAGGAILILIGLKILLEHLGVL